MAKLTTKFVNNIKPTNHINTYWDETLKGERVFAKNQPNSYTLTFYATENKYAPTNDWKKLTEERLICFKNKIKVQKRKRAEFRQKSRM